MHDAHIGLGHNGQLEVHQVVVILVHRPRQRILDRHHRSGRAALLYGAEDVFEAFAWQNGNSRSKQFAGGFFTEGAARSLKGNRRRGRCLGPAGFHTHFSAPSHLRTWASGVPIRSRTRSMVWSTLSITVWGW